MIIAKLLLVIVHLSQSQAAPAQEEGWRGIVPLRSTRGDVERVLGKPIDDLGYLYDTGKERILVYYQSEPCAAGDTQGRPARGGWNVPRDTVLSFRVHLKTKVRFSDLKIDRAIYKEARHPHGPDIVYYNNDEAGQSYEVDGGDGTVRSVSYYWRTKDESLRCPSDK